jgi:DNA-binding Lrp family transcriptional regulator
MVKFDKLDLDILRMIVEDPRAGVREYARRLNIARGTAQARVDKLENSGVLVSWRPQIEPAALGYSVLAFVNVHLTQTQVDETIERLKGIPELIEANSVAGAGDLLCRIIAKNNVHFEEVLQAILSTEGVLRTRSEIVLSRRIMPRIVPLIERMRPEA